MHALRTWSLTLVVAAAAAFLTPAAWAAGAAHAHDEAAATPALSLDHGKRWATDAPLRTGMANLRSLAAEGLAQADGPGLPPAQAAALAGRMEAEVATIVANCKLTPQADAMLHQVIARITDGTGAMAGKAPGASPAQGLVQVAAAVNDYGTFFDHPGFQPLRVAH